MSQATAAIANQSRTLFRGAVNAITQAIQSQNSGLTEPTETYAYMWWADTTTGILKQRNAANNAWVSILTLATGTPVGGVQSGAITGSGLTQATGKLLGRTTSSTGAIEEITPDSGSLTFSAGALSVKDSGITTAKILDANVTAAKLSGAQSGSAPIYGARAWCRFDGTVAGTNAPVAGGNVTSVQRVGTGSYVVNFTTAMQDANYAVHVTHGQAASPMLVTIGSVNTGSVAFEIKQPGVANYDQASVYVTVVR